MIKKYLSILLLSIFICSCATLQKQSLETTPLPTCTRVVDGDTIVVEGIGKIRLIGVDTPETVHPRKPVEYYGKEASAFTRRMVEGKKIRLEYDEEKRDKYDRILAYIYLPDGTFVNGEIVRRGYGFAYTKFPFKYKEEFLQFQREALQDRRGIWYFLLHDEETNQLLRKYHSLTEGEQKYLMEYLNYLVIK